MNDTSSIKVWDIGVRTFHWALVGFFAFAYISGEAGEDGGSAEALHAWSGYAIIALLAFRIVWGLIGSKHARFADFIYSPPEILAYLKSLLTTHPKHYLGHNPAGGAMVIVMLLSLIAVSWTGLKAYEAEGKGPLAAVPAGITLSVPNAVADDDWEGYGRHGGEGDEFWEEAHEAAVYFMLLLIALHLGGVAVSSLLHRENLVRAMLTGRKEVPKE